jgi:hypothetical protein
MQLSKKWKRSRLKWGKPMSKTGCERHCGRCYECKLSQSLAERQALCEAETGGAQSSAIGSGLRSVTGA